VRFAWETQGVGTDELAELDQCGFDEFSFTSPCKREEFIDAAFAPARDAIYVADEA